MYIYIFYGGFGFQYIEILSRLFMTFAFAQVLPMFYCLTSVFLFSIIIQYYYSVSLFSIIIWKHYKMPSFYEFYQLVCTKTLCQGFNCDFSFTSLTKGFSINFSYYFCTFFHFFLDFLVYFLASLDDILGLNWYYFCVYVLSIITYYFLICFVFYFIF